MIQQHRHTKIERVKRSDRDREGGNEKPTRSYSLVLHVDGPDDSCLPGALTMMMRVPVSHSIWGGARSGQAAAATATLSI